VYVRRASGNHYAGIMGAFFTYKSFACQLVNLHKIMNIRQRFELIFTHQDCGHTLLRYSTCLLSFVGNMIQPLLDKEQVSEMQPV
jgi:hypothetical protein